MFRYRQEDFTVADACIKSCLNHTWYLTEELVVLALFDPALHAIWKNMMVAKLKGIPRPPFFRPSKPKMITISEEEFPTLSNFIGPRSWLLFHLLKLTDRQLEWMQMDCNHWKLFEDYRFIEGFVRGLEVTNDCAERGVKLISDFIDVVQCEEQQKFLLQVVEDHRQRVPTFSTKENLRNV
jgi:hypothetical protein